MGSLYLGYGMLVASLVRLGVRVEQPLGSMAGSTVRRLL
jgi:hypothetical protein